MKGVFKKRPAGTHLLVRMSAAIIILAAVLHGAFLRPAGVDATIFPTFPSIPTFTIIDPSLWPVNIPDANLNAFLHVKCGKPMSEPLTRGDLAGLTGTLNIEGKGIANLEGIQFCRNIEKLNAIDNPLSNLPNMSGMTGLKYLWLMNCQFTSVPAGIASIPNLDYLDMAMNQITSITGLSGSTSLRSVNLEQNRLSSLPDPLILPNLTSINISDNSFDTFPLSIISLPSLVMLNISRNNIRDLPDEIASMPNLQTLIASRNKIRAIPASFGSSKIKVLFLAGNRIRTLPPALFDSAYLKALDVNLNRLTSVPSEINRINYTVLNLNFNFIDVSPGSSDEVIISGVNASEKHYLRQLTPITNLRFTPTENSILLAWDPSPDSGDGSFAADVKNYVVYLESSGTLTTLATLGKDVTMYTDTGLSPGQDRRYQVSVIYHVVSPFESDDIQHYTSISARTSSPLPSTTSEPTTVTTTASSEPSDTRATSGTNTETTGTSAVEPTSVSTESPSPQPGGSLPTWLFIAIGVVAAGGLAAAAVLLFLLRRKPG